MTQEQLALVIEAVKAYLGITWEDLDSNQRLTEIVRGGEAYINQKYGAAADYTAPGLPRTLLFEYTRYARDNALDVFENNYRPLILAMQNERLVRLYTAQQQAAQEAVLV